MFGSMRQLPRKRSGADGPASIDGLAKRHWDLQRYEAHIDRFVGTS
jgi:hypothetical protein